METCNVILDVEVSEKKLNIDVAIDSSCESTVLICARFEDPLVYDGLWSYC